MTTTPAEIVSKGTKAAVVIREVPVSATTGDNAIITGAIEPTEQDLNQQEANEQIMDDNGPEDGSQQSSLPKGKRTREDGEQEEPEDRRSFWGKIVSWFTGVEETGDKKMKRADEGEDLDETRRIILRKMRRMIIRGGLKRTDINVISECKDAITFMKEFTELPTEVLEFVFEYIKYRLSAGSVVGNSAELVQRFLGKGVAFVTRKPDVEERVLKDSTLAMALDDWVGDTVDNLPNFIKVGAALASDIVKVDTDDIQQTLAVNSLSSQCTTNSFSQPQPGLSSSSLSSPVPRCGTQSPILTTTPNVYPSSNTSSTNFSASSPNPNCPSPTCSSTTTTVATASSTR
jgi:hypothetical protein